MNLTLQSWIVRIEFLLEDIIMKSSIAALLYLAYKEEEGQLEFEVVSHIMVQVLAYYMMVEWINITISKP